VGMQKGQEMHSRLVSLLISTAVRYPEVGSVRYDPRSGTLRISLLLKGELDEQEHHTTMQALLDTVEVYTGLRGQEPRTVEVEIDSLGPLGVITVVRDVSSLSPGEIYTLVEFFRERFAGRIAVEQLPFMGEEEWLAQDEMIEEVLTGISPASGKHLIAIREDGRLMVFQK
jgi:hypothetical protein